MSGETFLNAENSGNLWAVGALPEPRWWNSQRSHGPPKLVGEGLLPIPKYPPHCLASPSFGILPNSLHSPVLRGLEKTLVEHDSVPC